MSAASDLQWGRQGGRVGPHITASEALTAINRTRDKALRDGTWPTLAGDTPTIYRCGQCDTGPIIIDGETWCAAHPPTCNTCGTQTTQLEAIRRGWHCTNCAPTIREGLARMADARRAAGAPLDHWDRRALGTLAPAKEVA